MIWFSTLGLPDDADIGVNCKKDGFQRIFEVKLISDEQLQDIRRHTSVLNPFLKEKNQFKIIFLLLLTDVDEYPVAVRYQTALLSAIFHMQVESFDEQAIAPYLEVVYRVKEVYKAGRNFFDLFSQP